MLNANVGLQIKKIDTLRGRNQSLGSTDMGIIGIDKTTMVSPNAASLIVQKQTSTLHETGMFS
jgi:hypothetical protein